MGDITTLCHKIEKRKIEEMKGKKIEELTTVKQQKQYEKDLKFARKNTLYEHFYNYFDENLIEYCPKCGQKILENWNFCNKCGKKIEQKTLQQLYNDLIILDTRNKIIKACSVDASDNDFYVENYKKILKQVYDLYKDDITAKENMRIEEEKRQDEERRKIEAEQKIAKIERMRQERLEQEKQRKEHDAFLRQKEQEEVNKLISFSIISVSCLTFYYIVCYFLSPYMSSDADLISYAIFWISIFGFIMYGLYLWGNIEERKQVYKKINNNNHNNTYNEPYDEELENFKKELKKQEKITFLNMILK